MDGRRLSPDQVRSENANTNLHLRPQGPCQNYLRTAGTCRCPRRRRVSCRRIPERSSQRHCSYLPTNRGTSNSLPGRHIYRKFLQVRYFDSTTPYLPRMHGDIGSHFPVLSCCNIALHCCFLHCVDQRLYHRVI